MRQTITRRTWVVILLSILLSASVAGGCGRQYATSEVSEQKKADIKSALEDYVASASGRARENSRRMPDWVADINAVELKEAAKMQDGYKALARLRGEGTDKTRYFLLRRTEEGLEIKGLLSP